MQKKEMLCIEKAEGNKKLQVMSSNIYLQNNISQRAKQRCHFIKNVAWFWYPNFMASSTLSIATQTWPCELPIFTSHWIFPQY